MTLIAEVGISSCELQVWQLEQEAACPHPPLVAPGGSTIEVEASLQDPTQQQKDLVDGPGLQNLAPSFDEKFCQVGSPLPLTT